MKLATLFTLFLLASPQAEKAPPFDVPAVMVEQPPPPLICTGDCMIPHYGPTQRPTCADQSRVLLTAEDGTKHCIDLRVVAPANVPNLLNGASSNWATGTANTRLPDPQLHKFYITTVQLIDGFTPQVVMAKDRLDAVARSGMTVWTEEEWKSVEHYGAQFHVTYVEEGRSVCLYDGGSSCAPYADFVAWLRERNGRKK